jgi:hypothetical protein
MKEQTEILFGITVIKTLKTIVVETAVFTGLEADKPFTLRDPPHQTFVLPMQPLGQSVIVCTSFVLIIAGTRQNARDAQRNE